MLPKNLLEISNIYDLLYRLGVTANCVGFFHASYAVYLTILRPERLLIPTKRLYPEVASQYDTTLSCVVRNIHTIAGIAWGNSRPLLEELARCSLPRIPTASRFLAILAAQFSTQLAA